MKKTTFILFLLITVVLISCQKENSITTEVDELGSDYFNTKKVETEWNGIDPKIETVYKKGCQKVEFSASEEFRKEYFSKLNERPYKELVDVKGFGYNSAVLRSGNCPSGGILRITLDCEDNNNDSYIFGWSGDTKLSTSKSLELVFCACNIEQFSSNCGIPFAILQIAPYIPTHVTTFEIRRYFDNEDDDNKNVANWNLTTNLKNTTLISPTRISGNADLYFYYISPESGSPVNFPTSVAYEYGVFSQNSSNHRIYTDDEDRNNINILTWDGASRYEIEDIMYGDENTVMYVSRILNGIRQ